MTNCTDSTSVFFRYKGNALTAALQAVKYDPHLNGIAHTVKKLAEEGELCFCQGLLKWDADNANS